MLKKIIAIIALFLGNIPNLFAGTVYLSPTLMYQNTYKSNIRYEELGPKVALGYNDIMHQMLYLAGEVFASFRAYEINNHSQNSISLRTKYSLGISFLPGFFLDPYLLVYGRLGLIYTDFDKFNTMKRGWQAGAGLQANLNPSWDIRAEYDFTQYNKLSTIGSPKADEFSLGAVYRFA